MRTSATRPPIPERRRGAGFTLLELLVVLALLGLATALVAPQGTRMIETWRHATDVDAALGSVAALGARARTEGRRLSFEAGPVPADAIEGIPEGWVLSFDAPFQVQPNGACDAASGTLRKDAYERRFAVEAPYCRIRLDEPAP